MDIYNPTQLLNGIPLDNDKKIEAFGELLNKVRNNLFHGEKDYDDKDDIKLLELINPLIQSTLEECAPYLTK